MAKKRITLTMVPGCGGDGGAGGGRSAGAGGRCRGSGQLRLGFEQVNLYSKPKKDRKVGHLEIRMK